MFRLGFGGEGLDGGFQRLGQARQMALRIIRPGPNDPWLYRTRKETDAGGYQPHDVKVYASVGHSLLEILDMLRRDFAEEFEGEVKMPGRRPADFGGGRGAFEFVLGALQFLHDGLGDGDGDEETHVDLPLTIYDFRATQKK